jgi:CheY-like chemotaxis protein
MKEQENYVLMVEDNPDDVELTLRSFRKNSFPYQIVVVRDGAQALDYLFCRGAYGQRDKRQMPALILLDLNLPKVLGLEVLKQVRDDLLFKTVPAAILSSSIEPKDRIAAESLGADLYIRKPINYTDFDEVAQQITDFLSTRAVSRSRVGG